MVAISSFLGIYYLLTPNIENIGDAESNRVWSILGYPFDYTGCFPTLIEMRYIIFFFIPKFLNVEHDFNYVSEIGNLRMQIGFIISLSISTKRCMKLMKSKYFFFRPTDTEVLGSMHRIVLRLNVRVKIICGYTEPVNYLD